ncbi:pentatricopeptide repeat-containing protein At1g32415, mitochondrial isoform X2 [Ziziphus jujuba]|uniref:Pentatricopeptide repeat-containing protein At1g32415, mitochondrial isoform X2 n=1 Tax=Ziziphus jujuba TaxID=326968 RepID=A0A6P4B3Z7_ZIZJJ|nr:pentatricopeptide repeat-containing protein At1g32415, mitochondrial isoform X2 [Ziziphus jujuba]
MLTSFTRLLPFALVRKSIKLPCCDVLFQCCKTQYAFSTTHYSKLTCDDSWLFQSLSLSRLQEARKLLEKLYERDGRGGVVHWTSLLTRYTKSGYVNEARMLFEIMPERNIVTYNAMLSGYVQTGRLSEACQFFEEMPERNVVSWTSMLCGLAGVGRIHEAWSLFNAMPEKNIVSWNSMIAGWIRNGDLERARLVFDQMKVKNIVSWNAMIAGYTENCRMEEARVLFDEMQDTNVITWTSMISGYCRSGNVDEGYTLFRRMPERNLVSWTAMIGGFAWNGFYEEALLLFLESKGSYGIKPNGETFISLAYACAGIGMPCLGKQLHSQLIVNGWAYDDYDGRLSKSLIHMYSTCGNMDLANFIFRKNLNNVTVQSLNSMINGYIRIGQLERAQNLFDKVLIRDKISWTSMIGGYFSVGQVPKACHMFWNMPDKDAIAWTAMISGHVQNELFAEAINLFSEMWTRRVLPLNSTYSTLLGATGAMAYLDTGRQFHCLLIKTHYEFDLILDNSLLSMYAKCGEIHDAYSIFSYMASRDLISWNSIIMGFSVHGLSNEALEMFEALVESGILPNSVTFLSILSACSHAGFVGKGWEIFTAMTNVYAIEPGHAIWGALLGVCGIGESNAKVAEHAAKRLLALDPLNAPAHVVLCNLYAANGQHVEEKMLRREMGLKGVRKVPGCSWILLKGEVRVFLSGDKLKPEAYEILLLLFNTVGES